MLFVTEGNIFIRNVTLQRFTRKGMRSMNREQKEALIKEMEGLLNLGKQATEKGQVEKAEKHMSNCYAMERTLKILGYQVDIDEDNCKVKVKE